MSSIVAEESSTLTGSPLYRLKHKWTIKGFAATYLAKPSTNKLDSLKVNSTWFSSSLDSQLEFRVSLRPRGGQLFIIGQKNLTQNHVSLHLEMKRNTITNSPSLLAKSADVNFKISLLNEDNEESFSQERRREFAYPSANNGWPNFLKHTLLQDPNFGLLPSDTLTILAEVTLYPQPVAQLGPELLLAKLKVASIESVRASHSDLLYSGELSDVVLVVEGREIAAHKTLLSAGSPVFSAMFMSEMSEQMEGKVIIPDMKVQVARGLLKFIYTGEAVYLAKYAQELLVAADKYDVAQLKALCSQYLCGQVDTENAARLFALADGHSVGQLKAATVAYIRAHLEEVMTQPDDWKPVHDLFIEELRLLKLKEKEDTVKDGKVMHQEESESAN